MKHSKIIYIFIFSAFVFLFSSSDIKAETSITITDKLEFTSLEKMRDLYPVTYDKAKINIEVLKNRCKAKYGNNFKYFAYYDNTYDFYSYENGEKVYSSLTCWSNYADDSINNTFNFYINNANNVFGHLSFHTKNGYLSLYNYSNDINNIYERELSYSYNEDVNVIYENGLFIDRSIYWVDTNVNEIVFDSHKPQFNDYVSLIDSVQINENLYKKGDVIIKNSSFVSPIKKPSLLFKEISHTLNDDKTYKTKTIDFSFDIFDTTKYKYHFSKDNVMFFDFKDNQVRITFNENTTIYFKVTDLSGNTIETYFYELNDINKTKYLDPSLDLTGKGIPNLSDSSYDDELDDDSESINGYIERFKKYFMKKFVIIEQVQNIYKKWSSYDPYYSPDRTIVAGVRCPVYGDVVYKIGGEPEWCDIVWSSDYKNKIPRLRINLSFVKIDKEFEIVDMGVLLKHRNDYFKWIYLSLGSYTFLKVLDRVIKIIRGFKHGS